MALMRAALGMFGFKENGSCLGNCGARVAHCEAWSVRLKESLRPSRQPILKLLISLVKALPKQKSQLHGWSVERP